MHSSIFRAESIGSIFRHEQDLLHGASGQIEQGQEGVHHVGCQVVYTA